jgi:hypothetical protein
MKLKLLAVSVIISLFAFGQSPSDGSINNTNYYDRFQNIKGHSLNWLRASDAVPIIIDQLLKSNIPYHTIAVGELMKINDTTRFVVTVGFRKGEKEYGFVYEPTHGIPLNVKDRDFLTDRTKAYFVQAEKHTKQGVDFMRIDPLPDNIFLLKQRCYWFQFDSKGTKYDVNKEVAELILRQDIDNYLKGL